MNETIALHDIVVCKTGKGVLLSFTAYELVSHFTRKSVAEVREVDGDMARVYVIGDGEEYMVPTKKLSRIDPLQTGNGFAKKICNTCYVLKSHSKFAENPTDTNGLNSSRSSCELCRRALARKTMHQAMQRKARKLGPKKGTLWKCPICEKRGIVDVTMKVVLDHQRSNGRFRRFLCDNCHTSLASFQNGEFGLRNAITYLEHFENKSTTSENGDR
ncbi:MAG: endonuclease domain-containing protein [Gammaproteobacteria bacterium]|nr:endonuclease domain-containing protein [Gammaproteobacteria bacterium]